MSENNNIPNHWQIKKLGEISKVKGGKRLPKGDLYSDEITNFPYLRVTDFENQSIQTENLKFLKESTQRAIKNYTISKNDIYISIAGTIGLTGTIPTYLDGANLTENAAKITELKDCSNKYISLYLSSIWGQTQIKGYTKTTTQPKLSLYRIEEIEIPIPPLPEQQLIVSRIEELLSDLENGKQQLLTAQQQLKVYRQSLLKWAFEGKLSLNHDLCDSDDGHELERNKRNQNNHYNQANHSSDNLPKGWKWVKLNEICKIIGGVTKGKDYKGQSTISLPYLRVANVQDGYLDLSVIKEIDVLPSDLDKYRLLFGDILYTEGGDKDKLGRGTIWKNEIDNCIHQNHIFRARPLSENINSKYVAYFSQTRSAKDYFFKHGKQTTNLASINLTILSNLPLPLCSKEEQLLIVSELESKLTVCDKIEETISQSLLQSESLRQSILKKAFEGKLV